MPMPYAPPGYFGQMMPPQYPPMPYSYGMQPYNMPPQSQPGYSASYPQPAQTPMVGTQQPQQIQSTWEVISVQSEDEARRYPVAPGNSVTFKDENLPYYYTKTVSYSQFEKPRFERYSLVKEDADFTVPAVEVRSEPIPQMDYATADDVRALRKQIEDLEELLTRPQDKPSNPPKKEGK